MAARLCDRFESFSEEAQDWCLASLPGRTRFQAAEVETLCERLQQPLARDRCFTELVGSNSDVDVEITCARVGDHRMRNRCFLRAATLNSRSLGLALDYCDKAKEDRYPCQFALASSRLSAWVSAEEASRQAELDLLFQRAPMLSQEQQIWRMYGQFLGDIEQLGLCTEIPPGQGRLACLHAGAVQSP
jgi:hypothetical protein